MKVSLAREEICRLGRSLFDRGYTHGSSGNISVRLDDNTFVVTPTNSSLGSLDPASLTIVNAQGRVVDGPSPTKELPLHSVMYRTRRTAGAIVHLHSTHSVAVSMLPGISPTDALPPLTAYYLMKVGRTALVPYFRPGDPAVMAAIEQLDGRYSAILLANHGPVVAGPTIREAAEAVEELEQTAKLYLLVGHRNPNLIDASECEAIRLGDNI